MTKTHDADLCERIRELEKRVEELERRPTPYWVQPWWNPPYWVSPWTTATPTITYGTTTGTITNSPNIGNVSSLVMSEQWSYTAENVS